jgi:hypothetical protein
MQDAEHTSTSLEADELASALGQPPGTVAATRLGASAENGLAEVWAAVRRAGERAGLGLLAASVATGLEARVGEVTARVAGAPLAAIALAGAWLPEGASPKWLRELVGAAGGRLCAEGEEPALCVSAGPLVPPEALEPSGGVAPVRRVWVDLRRPGPRLAEAAEVLGAVMHPGRCEDLARRHAARIA